MALMEWATDVLQRGLQWDPKR